MQSSARRAFLQHNPMSPQTSLLEDYFDQIGRHVVVSCDEIFVVARESLLK
jgi:hypothetical protein